MRSCSRSAESTRSCSISKQRRIADALARRSALLDRADLTAFRLFHGDSEGAPGLAMDRYGDVAVIHVDTSELLAEWLPGLRDLARTAYLKVHPKSARGVSQSERQRLAPEAPLWGPPRESVVVNELGVSYEIRPADGLSVGLFLDMRQVRQWLRSWSQDLSVLNLFAYTCSLGLSATLGQAARVVNLDLSRPYLERGKRNYWLNGCATDDRDFIYGDAFDWLARFARRLQYFDLVIVDPPSFSSTPFSVTRDYPRLVSAAARVVAPGGTLLAATNHAPTTDERFDAWLRRGLAEASRQGRVIERWHEPAPDFPVRARPYLKVRALVLD